MISDSIRVDVLPAADGNRYSLFIAMGVSSILMSALLAVDLDLGMNMALNPAMSRPELLVELRDRAPALNRLRTDETTQDWRALAVSLVNVRE